MASHPRALQPVGVRVTIRVLPRQANAGNQPLGLDDRTKTMKIVAPRKLIKRMHYPLEVMLTCVRWNATCPLGFASLLRQNQLRPLRPLAAVYGTLRSEF